MTTKAADEIMNRLETFQKLERKETDEVGWIAVAYSCGRAKAEKMIAIARQRSQVATSETAAAPKPNLCEYDLLTRQSGRAVNRVRLQGDGWYLEVTVTADGHGVVVRSGEGVLSVRPRCDNTIEVYTERAREQTIMAEAAHMHDVWKANEAYLAKLPKSARAEG